MATMTTEQWATGLIDALQKAGYKVQATPNNIQNIQRMIGYESSGNQAGFMRDNNPWNLNTYTGAHGSLPGGKIVNEFGIHVQTFDNVEAGYQAYVNQFKANPSILHAFETNATPEQFGTALSTSGWSSGHYANPQTFATGVPYTGSGSMGNNSSNGLGGLSNGAATSSGAPGAAPIKGLPPLQGMNTNYTGPGAYKGFDLSSLAPDLQGQAKAAIDEFTKTPGAENAMMTKIYQNYGNESWAASVPELRTVLVLGAYMGWNGAAGTAELQSAFQNTKWWKTSSDNGRLWQETLANDPGQAQQAVAEASSRVTNIANSLGVQLDQATLKKIATTVASQSVSGIGQFSNTQFTDQQIYQSITGAINSNEFTNQLTAAPGTAVPTGATAPVTAASTSGDAAVLYNDFTTLAHDYYLNLTPQQIAAQVQKALAADTGEGNFLSGAHATFATYAANMAKQMYPGLASVVGTTSTASGTPATPYESLAWARNMIAQYTGLGSGDNVNLQDPQWSWVLSGGAPPTDKAAGITQQSSTAASQASATANTGQIPSADTLQTYLMQTPQYQTTNQAKNQAWQVGKSITSAFGF